MPQAAFALVPGLLGRSCRESKVIVCIGWGSLIWCQKTLPVLGAWRIDGPELPVEFARESRDKRITLVVCEAAPPVTVLWSELNVPSLDQARNALAEREGIRARYIPDSIGYCSKTGRSNHPGADAIAAWAGQKGADAVVWTALKPKLGDDYRVPSVEEVIAHLKGLSGTALKAAEEYVRLAPRQIVTPYRTAIEQAFGWTAKGLV